MAASCGARGRLASHGVVLVAGRRQPDSSVHWRAPAILIGIILVGHLSVLVRLRAVVHNTSWLPTRDGFAWISLEAPRRGDGVIHRIGRRPLPA